MKRFKYPEDDVKPTNVLLVCDTNDYIWPQIVDYMRCLNRIGVDVNLAPVGPLSEEQRHEISRLHAAELFELTLGCAARSVASETAAWLKSLEQRIRPDVVHLFEPCYGNLNWQAPVVVTMDTCELSRTAAVTGKDISAERPKYWQAIAAGLHEADMVITPTEDFLRQISRIYGRPPRSAVVYQGRETAPLTESMKRDIVVAVGDRQDPAQNLRIMNQISSWCRRPVYVAAAQAPAVERESRSGLYSTGNADRAQQAAWLARANIAVYPTLHDPTGLLPLDAAAAGCALVLADLPAYRETWGDAAVYAIPNDPASFAQAINQLVDNVWKRKTISAAAQFRAVDYTPMNAARNTLEIYIELISSRRDAAIYQLSGIA